MITIIHGDDTASSRNYFFEVKQKYDNAKLLSGEQITMTNLAQELEGGGLFEESKTLFLEELLSKKSKGRELDAIIDYVNSQSATNTIFLWENKVLQKTAIAKFKHAGERSFTIPQTLFQFLDSLKPNNGQMLLKLFHKTIETQEPEMVFFMLTRQIRMLLALKDPGTNTIDEVKRLAPWQRSRFANQAQLFTKQQLVTLHSELSALDLAMKTGGLASDTTTAIDFFLTAI